MREMEFTIEDTEALKPGMEVGVTEGVLPTSYYYTIEHALGMSANFKQAERLKTRWKRYLQRHRKMRKR